MQTTPSSSATSDPQRAPNPTAYARLTSRTKTRAMREVKLARFSTTTGQNAKQQVVTEGVAEGSGSTVPGREIL